VVSVIIPALNEAARVGDVVRLARQSLPVEVVVVDDGSLDATPEAATAAGARVMTLTLLGKGASIEEGVRATRSPLLLFLDGDPTSRRPQPATGWMCSFLETQALGRGLPEVHLRLPRRL
jgi:glycosyltransferase involved in cell wall biosynthesis